ncbi:MAG: hypothetical protein IJ761_05455 [Bacteroidales bacterium]|nr:hypothetical protein [Bacteroidales bacterium]
MKSTTTLYILLVLTFINSGLSMLSGILMAALLPQMEAIYAQGAISLPTEFSVVMENYFSIPRPYHLSVGIINALSLVGAILMWKLRPTGFHCYTIAQLLLLIIPVVFLGKGYLGIGNIMFTLLFVAAYYYLMRSLGAFSRTEEGVNDTENNDNTKQ